MRYVRLQAARLRKRARQTRTMTARSSIVTRVVREISIVGLLVPLVACSFGPTAPTPLPAASTSASETGRTSEIINIDSRVNGPGNPVTILLEAGTYVVTPIGTEQKCVGCL
jgi:hypothetical protein